VRRNLLRERLDNNDVLVGVVLPFRAPDAVEFCGHLGFDWILIDGEHGGVGVESTYALVTAADAVEMASVVRVPANDPAVILGYAETGANGILAPHILSAAAGVELVQAVRYAPVGLRGAMSGSRAANYGLTQTSAEYFAAVDRQAIPIGMIEDKQALEELDEIVSVRGLDHFFIGPGDLAMSLGMPGMAFDPRVQDEVSRVVRLISGAGKTVGTLVNNAKAAERFVADGARMLTVSLGGLMAPAAHEFLKSVRQLHVA
jgi:2-keto-3-deoxy-L-rhamnonate aldolase RhmA